MAKVFKDADIKMEILIRLAFGYSYEEVAKAYGFKPNVIINLRKNNYILYNKLVDSFRILDEVALLELSPYLERAVNICKRFYKNKFIIKSPSVFIFNDDIINTIKVVDICNDILALDNIPPLDKNIIKKNLYMKKDNRHGRKNNNT